MFKFVNIHFVFIGAHGITQVSCKSVFVFCLLKFNQDEVRDIKRTLRFDWKFSVYLPLCTRYYKIPSDKLYFGAAFVKVY